MIYCPIPVHLQNAYHDLELKRGAYPVTERFSSEILSLPIHPSLRDGQIRFVADSIREFFQ